MHTKRFLVLLLTTLFLFMPLDCLGALQPEVSDKLKDQAAPDFSLKSIDEKEIKLSSFKGKIVLLNFFGTWCPPCRAEINQLTDIHSKYSQKGIVILGIVADSLMVPKSYESTKKDAIELKSQLGIPYEIAVATEQIGRDYDFKGIPTTIFIDSHDRFVRTFYGYHHGNRFKNLLDDLLEVPSSNNVQSSTYKPSKLFSPFVRVWVHPPQQVHPIVVHFPIVLLVLEGLFLFLFFVTKKLHYEIAAYHLLKWGLFSIIITIIAGLHDVGLELGAGNKILLGFNDRIQNMFQFESSITIHSWLAMLLLLLTFVRLWWRSLKRENVLKSYSGFCFGIVSLFSIWVLLAASYMGGLISHY